MSQLTPPTSGKYQTGQPAYGTDVLTDLNTIYSDYNGGITNYNINGSAAIADSKLAQITTAGKVSGTAITGLASLPAGAGVIPAANLPASSYGANDAILRGFELVWKDKDTVTVNAGVLFHGSTLVPQTTNQDLALGTAGNFAPGQSRGTSKWVYVGITSAGVLKFTLAPTKADSAGNTAGTPYYTLDTGVYYRCLGAIRLNATGSGELGSSASWVQSGNAIAWGIPAQVTSSQSAGSWTSLDLLTLGFVPAISTHAKFGVYAGSTASTPSLLIRPKGTTWATTNSSWGIGFGQPGNYGIGGQIDSLTDTSQNIEYQTFNCDNGSQIICLGYYLNIR